MIWWKFERPDLICGLIWKNFDTPIWFEAWLEKKFTPWFGLRFDLISKKAACTPLVHTELGNVVLIELLLVTVTTTRFDIYIFFLHALFKFLLKLFFRNMLWFNCLKWRRNSHKNKTIKKGNYIYIYRVSAVFHNDNLALSPDLRVLLTGPGCKLEISNDVQKLPCLDNYYVLVQASF